MPKLIEKLLERLVEGIRRAAEELAPSPKPQLQPIPVRAKAPPKGPFGR